jgi:hypothetical protein
MIDQSRYPSYEQMVILSQTNPIAYSTLRLLGFGAVEELEMALAIDVEEYKLKQRGESK